VKALLLLTMADNNELVVRVSIRLESFYGIILYNVLQIDLV
jgi:hypothetical protein